MSIKHCCLFLSILSPLAAQTAWETHATQGAGLERQGLYAQAAIELTAALKLADPDHQPETLNSLGAVQRELGDDSEAERCYRRAIAMLEHAEPARPLQLASVLQNLGALRLVQGRPSQAEPFYRRAYDLRVQALGPDTPAVALTLHGLARVAHERRRYPEAEDLYRRAAANLQSVQAADVWHNWAELYRETGRDAQARPLLEGAAATYEKVAPTHPKLAIVYRNLAELEAAAGNQARAQELFDRALALSGAALPQTGPILEAYARFLRNTHRKAEATRVETRARTLSPKTYTLDVSR